MNLLGIRNVIAKAFDLYDSRLCFSGKAHHTSQIHFRSQSEFNAHKHTNSKKKKSLCQVNAL